MIEPATLARLARLVRADPAKLQVRPLPGGLSNRSYLLSCDSDRWAVRLPPGSDADGPCDADESRYAGETLGMESERRVLEVAAAAKLTPEVVACDTETGALVTRYLQGATSMRAEQLRQHTHIDRIAATIRRLHGLSAPAGLRAFRPTEMARNYIDAARGSPGARRHFAKERRRWEPEFRRLAQAYEAAFNRNILCHNDLVAANILDDGQLWLVDFEYAVRADPILDLAGLAGLNGFGPARCHRLLDAYYGRKRIPITVAQLNEVVRLVRLMAFFWALAYRRGCPDDDRKHFAAAMAAMLR